MKKIFSFLVAAFLLVSVQSFGQTFSKGDKIINLGVGLGSLGANASVEYGITDEIGVGAFFVYERPSIGYLISDYSYTEMHFGVRGTYHLGEVLKLSDGKFDPYVAGGLGVRTYSYPYDYYYYADVKRTYVGAALLARVGARYNVSQKLGVWGELGTGGSWLQGGVSFKF